PSHAVQSYGGPISWSTSAALPLAPSVSTWHTTACGGGGQGKPSGPRPSACLALHSMCPAPWGRQPDAARSDRRPAPRARPWGATHVADTVLRVCIRDIRAVLQDSAVVPQYLETVSQQGYRFLIGDDQESPPLQTIGPILGRQHEVEILEGWFQRAAKGERQM